MARQTTRGRRQSLRSSTLLIAVTAVLTVGACRSPRSGQRVSPHETATYQVDGATIEITYGRPSTRGRAIFGALVPFDQVWMPGADESTMLKTSADLRVGDVRVPAGSYSLYTIPSARAWTLIINKQTGQWHTVYRADQDVVRTNLQVESLPQPVERLTISATPHADGGGELRIEWDTTRAVAPFTVRP